jgi:putative ABC transport system ATP-binding protein
MAHFQSLNGRGITIVLVTHEPDIASFARRTVVFRDGRIVEDRQIPRRRRAAEELASLPPPEEDRP